jgi:hypothetical protein
MLTTCLTIMPIVGIQTSMEQETGQARVLSPQLAQRPSRVRGFVLRFAFQLQATARPSLPR